MLAVNVSIEREESLVFFAAAAVTREARKRAPAPSDGALPGLPASPSGAGRRHRRFAGKAPDEVFKRFIFARKSFSAARWDPTPPDFLASTKSPSSFSLLSYLILSLNEISF